MLTRAGKELKKKIRLKDKPPFINDIALWLGLGLAVAIVGAVLVELFLLDPLSRF